MRWVVLVLVFFWIIYLLIGKLFSQFRPRLTQALQMFDERNYLLYSTLPLILHLSCKTALSVYLSQILDAFLQLIFHNLQICECKITSTLIVKEVVSKQYIESLVHLLNIATFQIIFLLFYSIDQVVEFALNFSYLFVWLKKCQFSLLLRNGDRRRRLAHFFMITKQVKVRVQFWVLKVHCCIVIEEAETFLEFDGYLDPFFLFDLFFGQLSLILATCGH